MDFKSYLKVCAHQINEEVEQFLSEFLNQVKQTNIKLLPLALGFINACKGGKRIRGTLVKLGYEIGQIHLGGVLANRSATIRGEIIKIGAAIEILHTALLIHDDIIDQSPIRRGQPSLYQALGGNHYGMSQAISLGDIGLYLPIKIISGSNFDNDVKIKAISHLSQTIIDTGWGQILDVELPTKKAKRSKENAKFVNLFKTAKYTIAGPLQLGAILAGANEEIIRKLGVFGENAGVAFQIQDDILDGETDSLDVAQSEALEYKFRAKKSISKLTKDKRLSTLLEQMAEYLVQRTK